MAKVVSYVNAFTSGEIGPDAWERTDLQQHAMGCAAGENLIGQVVGPMASRGGFWDRGNAISSAKPSRIVGFSRSTGDALFLEFGHLVMRVWTPEGNRVLSGGVPYEMVTPWTAEVVQRLWFKQINDVIYVTGLDGPPMTTILHQAADNWAWGGFGFADGPWLGEDPLGPTLTIAGGVVTASANVFFPTDLYSTLRFREGDGNPGWDTWTSATEYAAGATVQFDGRVYQRYGGASGKSGTTPPLHQSGTMSDGKLVWTFLHDGAGILQITGYISPTQVSVVVVRPGPAVITTAYWAKGAYSDTHGYPQALVAENAERLIVASSHNRPGVVDMTRTNGFGRNYGDFKPGLGTGRVVDDDAVRLDVGGTERVVWVVSASVLLAGCTNGEYVLSGQTMDDPITPGGRRAVPVSGFGNADVKPLMIQGPPMALLHVLASRKTVRDTRISPDLSVESYDRSILAHHIFERGVADWCWTQPDNIIWMRLDDGGLAAWTYQMDQEVYGVTRQPLPDGWKVESLDSARAAGGDLVMMSVMRVKDGQVQRRIWRLARRNEGVFVDGAQAYAGAPATIIGGLAAYEGETLAIVADGARIKDQVVEGGAITLSEPASHVVVGLKMMRRFESLPLDMEGVGSTNARTLLPTHATVILSCVTALVGTDAPDSFERVAERAPDDLTRPLVKRVRQRVGLGGGAGRDRRIVIMSDDPFDLVIRAYRLEAEGTS